LSFLLCFLISKNEFEPIVSVNLASFSTEEREGYVQGREPTTGHVLGDSADGMKTRLDKQKQKNEQHKHKD
jgi:hypothetical protein